MSYKNPKNAYYINNYTSLVVSIYPLKEYMSYINKKMRLISGILMRPHGRKGDSGKATVVSGTGKNYSMASAITNETIT
jgi:hypothetical protein